MTHEFKATKSLKTVGLFVIALGFIGCAGTPNDSTASIDEGSLVTKVFAPVTANCGSLETRASSVGTGKVGVKSNQASYLSSVGTGKVGVKSNQASYLSSVGTGKMGAAAKNMNSTCSEITVEVSGTCENCDSVIGKVGNTEFAASVDQNGQFSATVQTDSATYLTLTPMTFSGELSEAITTVSF